MEHRIFGIESEFGLSYVPHGLGRLSIEESAAALFKPVLDQWRSTNVFLPNGGRLYLDVGSHPEYASAECGSIDELLAQERAGELLFADLARTARKRLLAGSEGRPLDGELYLFKNNVDSAGNSYGSHENYLISREVPFEQVADALLPFFATRAIFTGAGRVGIGTHGEVPGFQISSRADFFERTIGLETTIRRPIVNTRDEPHADESKYRRLHVIPADANMSHYSNLLKFGTAALVMKLIESHSEQHPVLPGVRLSDPVAAMHAVSHDLSLSVQLPLAPSSAMSAPSSRAERSTMLCSSSVS